jgi:hypothetical protein
MKTDIETDVIEADYADMKINKITPEKLQGFAMRLFVSGRVKQGTRT